MVFFEVLEVPIRSHEIRFFDFDEFFLQIKDYLDNFSDWKYSGAGSSVGRATD
jgi:hypothetical protein